MNKVQILAGVSEVVKGYWYLPEAVFNGADQVCTHTRSSLSLCRPKSITQGATPAATDGGLHHAHKQCIGSAE